MSEFDDESEKIKNRFQRMYGSDPHHQSYPWIRKRIPMSTSHLEDLLHDKLFYGHLAVNFATPAAVMTYIYGRSIIKSMFVGSFVGFSILVICDHIHRKEWWLEPIDDVLDKWDTFAERSIESKTSNQSHHSPCKET